MTPLDDKAFYPELTHGELTLLLGLGERLVAELNLDSVLALVADAACQVVEAETLVVPMIDPDRQTFTYQAASGEYATTVLGASYQIHEGACGWVLQNQRPLLFGLGSSFELNSNAKWQPGMASSLLVPLICRGAIIGGLSAMGKRGGGAFNAHDLTVLTLFANQASIAIDNARLFQRLSSEETRMRLILDSASEAIYGIDVNGCCTFANPACLRMLGYTRETDLIGKHVHETIHHSRPDGSLLPIAECKAHRSIQEGRESHTDNETYWRRDGTSFYVEYWAHPQVKDGKVVGAVMTFVDITERKRNELELQETARRLDLATEASAIGIWDMNFETGKACHSRLMAAMLGYEEGELQANWADWARIVHPEDVESLKQQIDALADAPDRPYVATFRVRAKDGSQHWIESRGRVIEHHDGKVIRMAGTHVDITERKQAEMALRQSEETFKKLFADSSDPILLIDSTGVFVECNQAALDLLKMTREQFLLSPPAGISPEFQPDGRRSAESAPDTIALAYSKELHRFDWTFVNAEGGEFIVEVSLMPIILKGQPLLHVTWSDITEREAHQKQLQHIAYYDTLTGLPNRVLLADRLHQAMAQALRRGDKLAVAYLDLDGFKTINDQHGHDVGDRLLTTLAGHMKRALREGDTLARLGGDEFVAVILDLPDVESCVPLLSRLLSAAAEVVHENGNTLRVSASLGVTFFPQPEAIDADQLLRQADQAMYQAKLAGKNRYHIFDTEQDRSVRGHHVSLEQIKQALDERQFVLYYQPKVNMRTGDVIGAEALIRWQHPERGLLPPGAFLPLIADHPLAIEMGEWVLDTAMTQIETWKATGLLLPVSVNIDAMQLEQVDFVDRLRQQLVDHPAVAAGDLDLEVLETSALEDIAHVSSVILACRDLGVGFALDDFGTGYSSLTYLKRLPAGTLKIDQSFVRDMLDDPEDLAILNGVIGLASAFRRHTIAEGVETLAHGEMLLQLGCELAQGYVIARPMPAEDIPVWLAAWRPDSSWLN